MKSTTEDQEARTASRKAGTAFTSPVNNSALTTAVGTCCATPDTIPWSAV
jgi:hypothetical protein